MLGPLNAVWKIPRRLTSHTLAYAYFSNILFDLGNIPTLLLTKVARLRGWIGRRMPRGRPGLFEPFEIGPIAL